MNGKTGYFHSPTIVDSKIAFVSEDDLWLFDTQQDTPASRLTASEGRVAAPVFSPDGSKIAYSSNEYDCNEYIQVIITSTIKTFFAPVIGIESTTNTVSHAYAPESALVILVPRLNELLL